MDALEVALRAARFDFSGIDVTHHALFAAPPAETTAPAEAAAGARFTIVQISDLHLHIVGRREENVLEAIEAAAPDLLVLTGDAIDDPRKVSVLESFLSLLDPLVTRAVAILGNWEHFAEIEAAHIERNLERHGVELLCNRTVVIEAHGRRLAVTGFDDLIGGRPDPARAFADLPSGMPQLILGHCPAFRDVLTSHAAWRALGAAPRTMLAGHTHGGQIRIGSWAPVIPIGTGGYVEGWFRSPELDLYVNRGIGMSLIPLRIGARPEVTVFYR